MARNCLGVKSTGKCGCEEYVFERVAGAYEECFCSHVKGTHIFETAKTPTIIDEDKTEVLLPPKNTPRREPHRPRKVAPISKVETGLTPAEARAKLRAAGHQVGARGRLKPEQMALAATL